MWLKNLLGFTESKEAIYKNIEVTKSRLKSKVNNKEYEYGTLETPSLKELRERVAKSNAKKGKLSLRAIKADVKALHLDANNENALFQVASQFNLLEMVGADVSPETGIEQYEHDHTQGPICAICCGAGTIYRNYFVELNASFGQSSNNQIDCLAKMGEALGNENEILWEMKNGYALLKEEGLETINIKLKNSSFEEIDTLRENLQIGLVWQTQVTLNESTHKVSQAYCSALPISYVGYAIELWKPFAFLVLEASYEATICAGVLNGDKRVYLTLVGGGVFGNKLAWILSAIKRACLLYADYELEVIIVNYGVIPDEVKALVEKLDKEKI